MKKFMLLLRGGEDKTDTGNSVSKEDLWEKWLAELDQSKMFIDANYLSKNAKLVYRNKKAVDEKLLANKNEIKGYVLIQTTSLKEAILIATDCPILFENGTVEVRTVTTIEP